MCVQGLQGSRRPHLFFSNHLLSYTIKTALLTLPAISTTNLYFDIRTMRVAHHTFFRQQLLKSLPG